MNRYIRTLIKYVLTRSDTGKKLLFCRSLHPYLEQIGWFRSYEHQLPVDRHGNCLPWFTYSVISFLEGKVRPEMTVCEYGSGNSTLWWSSRVTNVVSYEHDLDWYRAMHPRIPSNVVYQHRDLEYGGGYCTAILSHEKEFDVIIIDGRDRVNCARNSVGALKQDGVIIWDNSDREEYEEGYSHLFKNNFKRLDFEGHGPIGVDKWCTSIFYRSHNCFDI